MVSRLERFLRNFALLATFVVIAACSASKPTPSGAAPYAAYVMDARTGETIYESNANARLHPASLTKMMTLYIAFEAIERGEISLDTMVTISKHAAAEPPSRLGLKPGQRIALRHLIRAAAIKSANDAATAIGEAVGGSEEKFAARMNRTAKAIGMSNTTFANANGLTRKGHLSTAHDMSILGRRLFYDFPQYYNIFSRRETDAGVTDVVSTNRRFLDAYKGADGIKTGFTNAAGFNLTASAERNGVRIIATVFGGTSTAQRNAKVAELLDLGFASVKPGKKVAPVGLPPVQAQPDPVEDPALVAEATLPGAREVGAKTVRVSGLVASSPRPRARPAQAAVAQVAAAPAASDGSDPIAEMIAAEVAVNAMQDDIFGALAEATGGEMPAPAMQLAAAPMIDDGSVMSLAAMVPSPQARPEPEPEHVPVVIHTATPAGGEVVAALVEPTPVEVVTRISTSGGRHWGVNIGRFPSRVAAERALTTTMLEESATLNESLRKIVQRNSGFDANFMGLSQKQAELACLRLQARGTQCFAIGP
ncbi:D-alanyl-D-alanine carboxypeptidase family protein [Gemmobacter serpentinus]|uniref:D-alanyl-D-alanine carboxypeptidase family protein n=1 Tax=Gemmobacter serpentinus TaxID=2652247 RepID=UPI00124EDA50|nr:D-alanyl-D-alanine carboxypeptidase family protein [Gemmobacter serpentinus]